MSDLFSFWKEAPTQTGMYPCPACHETISIEAAGCRFCHVPIEANVAQQLLAESRRVTTAIARANTFSFSARVAFLVTGFALWQLYSNRDLPDLAFICPFIALAYGANWLRHNSALVTHDVDYPAAVTRVKWIMMVWGASLLLQIVAYLILNGLS